MKKRFTEEQIIDALKEHEAGVKVDELCRRLGIVNNKKHTYRLYQKENLPIRTKKRKKLNHPCLVMNAPTTALHVGRWVLSTINAAMVDIFAF